jgi:hypothetical protein
VLYYKPEHRDLLFPIIFIGVFKNKITISRVKKTVGINVLNWFYYQGCIAGSAFLEAPKPSWVSSPGRCHCSTKIATITSVVALSLTNLPSSLLPAASGKRVITIILIKFFVLNKIINFLHGKRQII